VLPKSVSLLLLSSLHPSTSDHGRFPGQSHPADAELALGFFRSLVADFPPAAYALKMLVDKQPATPADKHALASAVYSFGRALLPDAVGTRPTTDPSPRLAPNY